MYASPLNDREDVVDALKESELGQYVAENYNTNSLTALVREVEREVETRAQDESRMSPKTTCARPCRSRWAGALKISFVHKLSRRKKA